MRSLLVAVLCVLVQVQAIAQEGSREPVDGPLTAALERRMDAIAERVAEQSKILQALEERIEARQAERYEGIISSVREYNQSLKLAIEDFRADRTERIGLMSRLREGVESVVDAVDNMRDLAKGFAPFRWLVDRATGIIWAVVGFIVAALVLLMLVLAIVLRLYLWARNSIVPKDLR
jgi:hypothetical protein